jgi:Carboxypeptidase regulatory-like domain/TonB-dependent Receptor Plug Domain
VKNTPRVVDRVLLGTKWFRFLFLLIGLRAFAQVGTANVMGIVQDSSGAAISESAVKLVNRQTGAENDSKTSGDGRFILAGVIPGSYTLQIERGGFATTQLNGIVLNVGDTKNLLIRLKVGSVSESVTVDASGLTLNTTDAALSTLVDRKFVNNIPLNGRSFQDLISMTPGVVTQSPQAAAQGTATPGDFSVNGQRPSSNSFFVDGVSANINLGLTNGSSRITTSGSSVGATALGTSQSLVSIDALQEFRVLSSSYSAEYGRTPGGQFTFLTRSGTSTVHGSLYTYWRDYVVDAPDWFAAYLFSKYEPTFYMPPPPKFSQNDFGGTIGAPIVLPGSYYGHDKTFLFASYEGLLLSQPEPASLVYVPSTAIFNEAPAPLQNVLTFLGGSLFSNGSSALTPFVSYCCSSLPARVDSTSIRIDHTVSPGLSLFFRYGDTPSSSQTLQHPFSFTTSSVHTQTFTLGATSQLSATKSNDFRLGIAKNNSSVSTEAGRIPDSPFLLSLSSALGIPYTAGPSRADVFIHIPGIGDSEENSNSTNSSLSQWNFRDTFNLQQSNHLFKFGIDNLHIASTLTPSALSVQTDFFTRQSLVANLASDIVISKSTPASPVLNEFSAFTQDEWHASSALTLSMGLRWEVNPPPSASHGTNAYTTRGSIDSPTTLSLAPRGTPLWHANWFNLAPRFGAAWMITNEPGGELILRAGAGVFFDTATRSALGAFSGVGFTTTSYYENAPVPVTSAQLDLSNLPGPASAHSLVFAFPSHLQLPYSTQWNVGLEKALGKSQALTISYVGAHGERLLQEQRKDISQLNPSFGDVSFFPSGLTSNYQALQMKFQRSISPGIQALASYTWAHTLDYGSTDPLYPFTYGNSDLDVRHNVEAALSWELPRPMKSRLMKYVLGSWVVDGRLIARTAFPVTLLGNLLSDPATGDRYYNGVDLIPNRPLYSYNSQFPGGRILNGGPTATNPAFILPDGTDPGNAPRNFVRGFNAVQANLALRREMPIYERVAFQFQVDAFNVLNHPNFGYIDPSLSHALFGQSTEMLNQSFGSDGSLYQQGGPRSVQISVKILF